MRAMRVPIHRSLRPGRTLAAVLATLLALLAWSAPARAGSCAAVACVSAGPRLVSVDSAQSAILNPLLGGLLGGNLTLSVLDWNAVATTDLRLDAFLGALKVQAGVASVDSALTSLITVAKILEAAAQAAEADGNTAGAGALRVLKAQVGGLSGTIALGDLLKFDFPTGAFADARINALNLVTGGAQLFNRTNAVTTGGTPITLSGVSVDLSGLGLGVNTATPTVQLFVQIVEPPIYLCGPQGSTFHTAAVRVKLDIDLSGVNVGVTGTSATMRFTTVSAYLEVARADGTLALVNAVTRALTLNGTPGLARLGIGQLSDSVFFDRSRDTGTSMPLPNPAKIAEVTTSLAGFGTVYLDVNARSLADGTYPLASVATVGPYPQAVTVGSSSAAVATLVGTLVTNLNLTLTLKAGQTIPALLQSSLTTLISSLLQPVKTTVGTVLQPTLEAVLKATVDQVLRLLGVGIGEAVFTIHGVNNACQVTARVYRDTEPDGSPGPAETWDGPAVSVNVTQSGSVKDTSTVGSGPGTVTLTVPEGTRSVLVATAGTAPAAAAPAGYVFTGPQSGTVSVTVAAGTTTVADPSFGLFPGDRITGVVFLDDGYGSAVAHDGQAQGSEYRVGSRAVTVSGSLGTRTTTTAADGTFTAYVPSTWTGVTVTFTGPETVTGVTVGAATTLATDVLATGLRPASLPDPAGQTRTVQLGLTDRPALNADQSGRTIAPGTVRYVHTLAPGTTGTVTLAKTGAFPGEYHLDTDCDGTVSAAERTPVSTVTVDGAWPRDAAGHLKACALEVQVSVPALSLIHI